MMIMTDYTPSAARIHIENHQRHIAAGGCPAVSATKAWCNGVAGHPEPHHAPYLEPNGKTRQVFWDDDDGCPCRG